MRSVKDEVEISRSDANTTDKLQTHGIELLLLLLLIVIPAT